MNTDTLEYPEITDAPRADVAVAAPAALDLRKIDLTDVALAKFGDWRKETADTKAELDKLALDLSTQARIDEAASLRHRKINAPLALARKASAGLKSKLTSVSKSVGAELEAIESAWADVATAITPQIEAAQKKIDDAKEAARQAENVRLANLRIDIDYSMTLWVDRCTVDGITAERIGNGIAALRERAMPPEYADVAAYWEQAKAATLVTMTRQQNAAAALAEAARLEAQRLENERVAAEQRAEAERLAEQQRLLAEQAAELQRKVDAIAAQERLAEERQAALLAEQELNAAIAAKGEADNPAPADAPAEAAPITQDAQSGFVPGTPGLCTSNGAEAAEAPPSGLKGQGAHAEDRAPYPARTKCVDPAACRGYQAGSDCWATCGGLAAAESFDYIPPVVADFELKPQTEAEIQAANGPEVDPLSATDPVWGDRATVSMADINARLGDGITLTSDFLRLTLQIPTAGRERAAYRFYASDWPSIRAGLIDHIEARA
jgi:hypothetical protein